MNCAAPKFCAALIAAAVSLAALPARAGDIVADWDRAKLPPKPELKSVTVDPKTTALLVLDLMKTNCGVRPRCPQIVPHVKKLLDDARAHDMLVVYNLTGSGKVEARPRVPARSARAGATGSRPSWERAKRNKVLEYGGILS